MTLSPQRFYHAVPRAPRRRARSTGPRHRAQRSSTAGRRARGRRRAATSTSGSVSATASADSAGGVAGRFALVAVIAKPERLAPAPARCVGRHADRHRRASAASARRDARRAGATIDKGRARTPSASARARAGQSSRKHAPDRGRGNQRHGNRAVACPSTRTAARPRRSAADRPPVRTACRWETQPRRPRARRRRGSASTVASGRVGVDDAHASCSRIPGSVATLSDLLRRRRGRAAERSAIISRATTNAASTTSASVSSDEHGADARRAEDAADDRAQREADERRGRQQPKPAPRAEPGSRRSPPCRRPSSPTPIARPKTGVPSRSSHGPCART